MWSSERSLWLLIHTSLAEHGPAFLYYNWLLDLSEELQWIWKVWQRRSLVSLVYILLRYTEIAKWTLWTYSKLPMNATVSSPESQEITQIKELKQS